MSTEFVIAYHDHQSLNPLYVMEAIVRVYEQKVDITWSLNISKAKKFPSHEKAQDSIDIIEYCSPTLSGKFHIHTSTESPYNDYDRAMGVI